MKVADLWGVFWCGPVVRFVVVPMGEALDRNRAAFLANEETPLAGLLDVRGSFKDADEARLDLELKRFGHAVCGRKRNEG